MKSPFKNLLLLSLTLCVLLGGATQGNSQITVKVDSTKPWQGYMNRFDLNNGYVGGQPFGLDQLRGNFVPNLATATRLILQVNTNTYNPADPFWTDKNLEANCYVDVGTLYAGQEVTFVGTVESNTIPADWTCEAVIKEFNPGYSYVGDTRVPVVAGAFSVTRTIGAGRITQYGFLTYGTNAAPGSVPALQAASIVVDNADPSITGVPVNQRAVVGGTASFNVAATGGSVLSYQWARYATNLLNAVGKFSGANSSTLTISNAQLADATTYSVIVTDTAGSATNTAQLKVLTPAQFANCLDNPSFELDVVAPTMVPDPWINFSGSALQNTNDLYAFTPEAYVQTVQGTNVVQVYNAGQYNGIYQDVPASPGDVFTGDGWLWQSSYDPLLAAVNEAYLEVQFRQGNANPIAIYNSILVTNTPAMLDTWLHLQATNGVAAGYAQTSTANANSLVAPAGTDHVRYQITLHAEGGGGGSVYVDAMSLMKKIPVTLSSSVGGANITISWLSQGATSYQVEYKDNVTDTSWTPLGSPIAGDGTVKSASYSPTGAKRFYRVITL